MALHAHVSENALLVGQSDNTFNPAPSGDTTLGLCKEYDEFMSQICANPLLPREQQSRFVKFVYLVPFY